MTFMTIATTPLPPPSSSSSTLFTRIRLATVADVPQLHRMIHRMAVFEKLTHIFSATTETLSATLFPPHHNHPSPFTVLILEVSTTTPFPSPSQQLNPHFNPIPNTIHHHHLNEGEEDDQEKGGDSISIAGYVVFFPVYATLLGKPGIHVDNIFVRKFYRRKGLGKLLLSAVAKHAAKLGYARVEWKVFDWNVDAIKFYQDMGAEIMHEWKIGRFSGKVLEAYGEDTI